MSSKQNKIQAHLFISGQVQGVGFRWNTQKMAQRLNLTGQVRNLYDGRVEAIFEGPANVVDQAIDWCRHGPGHARVKDVDVRRKEYSGQYNSFRIAH